MDLFKIIDNETKIYMDNKMSSLTDEEIKEEIKFLHKLDRAQERAFKKNRSRTENEINYDCDMNRRINESRSY